VTHLRQLMIEELQRRNFAESTIRSYVHGVEHFSQYFHRRPDRLGPQHTPELSANNVWCRCGNVSGTVPSVKQMMVLRLLGDALLISCVA
jgi:hypothetical protein